MFSAFHRRAKSLDVLTLIRNLAVTIKAGVPIARALALFERDTPRGTRKRIIKHLRIQVESGHSLAAAIESAPRRFPPLVMNLVRVGEKGGTLADSLADVVDHLKSALDLKRKIRNAMMYPTFVLIAVLGLGLSVGTMVLPELLPLFSSLDVELPITTQMLLVVAQFFEDYGVITSVVTISVVAFLFFLARLEISKPIVHRLLLMLPYIRHIQRQAAVAQITRTLSTLLKAGIPISSAIPSTAEATGNRVFQRALKKALPSVEAGHTFADGLRRAHTFPEMASTLIDVAEETGTLTETLDYLAEYYEGEVDYAVKNLTTAIEPMLLIVIGVIVGFTVLAIITPIYDVTGNIR